MSATQSPTQICRTSHGLHVLRVNAMPNPTKVVEVKCPVNWSVFPDVEAAMSQMGSVGLSTELAVPVGIPGPRPEPTSIKINFVPRPVVKEGAVGSTRMPESRVVLAAHRAPQATGVAFLVVDCASRVHGCTIHQVRR